MREALRAHTPARLALAAMVLDALLGVGALGSTRGARSWYQCDLIVMGSHGYGLVDQVLGTTASKVVHRTDRNILVVRAHA